VSAEDALTRDWALTPADAAEVLRGRGATHRLRSAVQLCALRATGRFAADYGRVPPEAVSHLAQQLGLDPVLGSRDKVSNALHSNNILSICMRYCCDVQYASHAVTTVASASNNCSVHARSIAAYSNSQTGPIQ